MWAAGAEDLDQQPVARVMFVADINQPHPSAELTIEPGWEHAVAHFVGEYERARILPVLRAMLDARRHPPADVDALADQTGGLLDQFAKSQPRPPGRPPDTAGLVAQYRAEQEIRTLHGGTISVGDLNSELWQRPEFVKDDEGTLRRRRQRLASMPDLLAALSWQPLTDEERRVREATHAERIDAGVRHRIAGRLRESRADQSPPNSPPK